jgi:phage-related protein
MDAALKAVDKFGKEAKKLGEDASKVAGSLAVLGGAAVKLASTVDGPAKAAMTGLEESTKLLAVQVADVLQPAVKELTEMFHRGAQAVAVLNPETKKQIADFAVLAVQAAAAGKALGVLGTALSTVANTGQGSLRMVVSFARAIGGLGGAINTGLAHVIPSIISSAGGMRGAFASLFGLLRAAPKEVGSAMTTAATAYTSAPGQIAAAAGAVGAAFTSIFQHVSGATTSIVAAFSAMPGQITRATTSVVAAFSSMPSQITRAAGAVGAATSALGGSASGALKAVGTAFTALPGQISGATKVMGQGFLTLAANIVMLPVHATQAFASLAASSWSAARSVGSSFASLATSARAAFAASALAPVLTFVAAVALIAGIVAVVHRAWRKNWGGIQDATGEVVDWIRGAFGKLANFIGDVWDFVVDGVHKSVKAVLKLGDIIERVTGKNLGMEGIHNAVDGAFKDLKSGEFISVGFKFGKTMGAAMVDGVKKEFALIGQELGLDKLMQQIHGAFSGGGGPIALGRGKSSQVAITASGKLGSGHDAEDEQMAAEEAAANAIAKHNEQMRDVWAAADAEASKAADIVATVAKQTADDAANAASRAIEAAENQEAEDRAKRKAMSGMVLSNLGALGRTINSISQGAQAGGIWGAIAAAVMEVLQHSKSFQRFLGFLSYGLERLGQMVDPLVSSIADAASMLTAVGTEGLAPLFQAVTPLFQAIGEAMQDFAPVMVMVGMLFGAVANIIKPIAQLLGGIMKILEPIFRILYGIATVVVEAILSIEKGVIDIWNWLLTAVADVVAFVVNLFTAGAGGAAAKAEILKLKGSTVEIDAQLAALHDTTFEVARAQAAASTAAWDAASGMGAAAATAQNVSEQLTNIPSGFKLKAAQFSADLGISASRVFAPGTPSSSAGAAGGSIYVDTINVDGGQDTKQLAKEIREEARKEKASRRGNRFADNDL